MSTLSQRIAALRHEQGMTQTALAQQLPATRGAVAQWETGKSAPGLESLTRLAQIFQVSVDYLLGRCEERRLESRPGEQAAWSEDDPELAALLQQMFAQKSLRHPAHILLFCGQALNAGELEILCRGASPLRFPEVQLVRFFRKFPLEQVRAYYRAARVPLPQPFLDLESELRDILTRVRMSTDGSPEALEYVLQLAQEIFAGTP